MVDIRQDTSLGNSDVTQQLVQFLVVADGELKVTGNDTRLLVVTSSVAGQFEDFSSKVFENCSQIDGGTWREHHHQQRW